MIIDAITFGLFFLIVSANWVAYRRMGGSPGRVLGSEHRSAARKLAEWDHNGFRSLDMPSHAGVDLAGMRDKTYQQFVQEYDKQMQLILDESAREERYLIDLNKRRAINKGAITRYQDALAELRRNS